MKKIITLILVFILASTNVFANGNAEAFKKIYDKNSEVYSGEITVNNEIKLNQPLEIFNTIPLPEDADIDLKMLAESLTSGKTEMTMSYSASDDFKKITAETTIFSDSAIAVSDEFSMSAKTKMGMWIDYDFTDKTKPVYKVFFKFPFYKKYVGMDLSGYFANNPDEIPNIDKAEIKKISEKLFESFTEAATIKKTGKKYTVKLDDAAAKNYIITAFEIVQEMVLSKTKDKNLQLQYDEIVNTLHDVFDKVTFFGEDGLKAVFETNTAGFITKESMTTHVKLNVFDILTAFEQSTEGLEREKAFIDMNMISNISINKHNKTNVILPELTDENSYIQDMSAEALYESNHIYFDINAMPVFANQEIYYPIDEISKKCGFTLTREGSVLTLDTNEKFMGIFKFEEDKNSFLNNEVTIEQEVAPLIIRDDKMYISGSALIHLSIYLYSGRYDFEVGEFSFSGRYAPQYEEVPVTVDKPEAEEIMVPGETNHFYFASESMPYTANDVYYMPLGCFLENNSDGELSISEAELNFTAKEEKPAGIEALKAVAGSNVMTVNGDEITLDAPAVYYKNDIVIPVSYFEKEGFDVSFTVQYYDKSVFTDYSIIKPLSIGPTDNGAINEPIETPKKSYYSIYFNQAPHIENKIVYMPVYEFVSELYTGEFSFDIGYIKYTQSENHKNEYEIETISAHTGDSFVKINDKEIALEAPVIEVDNVIQIPVSFSEELELKAYSMYCDNNHTTISFFSDEDEDFQSYVPDKTNWFYSLFNIF